MTIAEWSQHENRDRFVCVTHVKEFKLHVKGMRSY